jgi:hypothetical protein
MDILYISARKQSVMFYCDVEFNEADSIDVEHVRERHAGAIQQRVCAGCCWPLLLCVCNIAFLTRRENTICDV